MESFSIGRTLSRAFRLIGSGFGGVGIFLLIAYVANTAVSAVIQPMILGEMAQATDPTDPMAALSIFGSAWYWLTILASLAIGALIYSGSIHGYLQVARGKEASIGECFSVGFAKLLPMLGLTLLWFLGIGLGFMLLIVPGVILITIWAAAMPALVGEGRGVFEAFGRSRALTRGSRWSIFGVLFILIVVIYVLMFMLLGGLIGGAALGGGLNPEKLAAMSSPLTLLGSAVIGWAMSMLLGAVITSIYVELVQIKEGSPTGELSEVFG